VETFALECTACGHSETEDFFSGCPMCGSILQVVSPTAHPHDAAQCSGIWRELGHFGVAGLTPVSLDEGSTPLVGEIGGRGGRYVKFEGANPTGSWKDRFQSVNATVARHLGYRGLSVVSTGNSALAAAAYANRAGVGLLARLSERAPKTIVQSIRDFGFDVEIADDRPPDLHRDLIDDKLFPATMSLKSHGVANPFGLEGYKTIAYEIVRQLGGVPDWVAVPVGCGDGLYGIAKGFTELVSRGIAGSVPRLLAVQSDQAAPLVAALRDRRATTTPVTVGPTVALSIAVDTAGNHALAAIRRSGGSAVAVSDSQIMAAQAALRREGISAEPSSAAAWAGVVHAEEARIVTADDVVVAVVTSNGYRWIS
jgi:threonine synthase